MKFNKSEESDKWYVGFDNDRAAGVIYKMSHGFHFDQLNHIVLSAQFMRPIVEFMEELERQHDISTTSTFTSNEDR